MKREERERERKRKRITEWVYYDIIESFINI